MVNGLDQWLEENGIAMCLESISKLVQRAPNALPECQSDCCEDLLLGAHKSILDTCDAFLILLQEIR